MQSTGGGNGNLLQYYCLKNPMNSMKRQKDMTPEDEHCLLQLEGVQYPTGEEQRAITNSFRKMKWLGQNGNDTQLCMCLVVKVKSDGVKNHIAQEPGILSPRIKVNQMWSKTN